jgi:hypothetical protein
MQNSDLRAPEDWPLDVYSRNGKKLSKEGYFHLRKDPGYKIVRKAEVGRGGKVEVSTVWLGMNHAYGSDVAPLIFETMVFGGKYDQYCDRYSTEAEAIAGHARWVRKVRRAFAPVKDTTQERIEEYRAIVKSRAH